MVVRERGGIDLMSNPYIADNKPSINHYIASDNLSILLTPTPFRE